MARLLTLELTLASIALLPHVATSLIVPAPRVRVCAGLARARKLQQWRRHQQRQLSIDMATPACEVKPNSERTVSSPPAASKVLNGLAASALCLLSLSRVAGAEDGESSTGFYPVIGTGTTYISRSTRSSNLPALSTSTLFTASAVAEPPISVADYLGRVFASPNSNDRDRGLYNAVPAPTDPQYDTKEARNRAYDAAFEQDARDRDAYYGKLAMEKRRRAEEDVARYRRELGLDGTGDVRPRVGDERVAGMASLREYLLQQDPATLTPEELKVYRRLKQNGEENQYRQQQEGQAAQKEDL